jgi:hypothetical protein
MFERRTVERRDNLIGCLALHHTFHTSGTLRSCGADASVPRSGAYEVSPSQNAIHHVRSDDDWGSAKGILQQLADDPFFHERLRSSRLIDDRLRFGVDPQVVVQGGDNFLKIDGAMFCEFAPAIGRADDLSGGHASTREESAAHFWPVVASGVFVDLR